MSRVRHAVMRCIALRTDCYQLEEGFFQPLSAAHACDGDIESNQALGSVFRNRWMDRPLR